MGSLNRWMGIGNLGTDPEVRHTPGGQAVCNFRIACNESWKDKQGQKQERTEWISIVVWGKLGELCGQYLAKGRQVYIEGNIQTRKWTNKEGQDQYTTEIVARNVVFLSSGQGGGQGSGQGSGGQRGGADDFGPPPPGFGNDTGKQGGGGPSDEDIPF